MTVLEMLSGYDSVEAFVDHDVDPGTIFQIRGSQFKEDDDRSVHDYAVTLIFGSPPETKLGLDLLKDELADRTKDWDKAELLFLSAVGNLRLKEHSRALNFASALKQLRSVRYDQVADELLEVIHGRIVKESVKNIAIVSAVGGIVMAGLYALTSYFLPRNRRRGGK